MAKQKKKNKSGGGAGAGAGEKAESKEPASSAAPASTVPATGNKLVDQAYASGNYAAIRHFAENTPEAAKLLQLTKIDMGQAVVGLIAMIVVLSVAIATLH